MKKVLPSFFVFICVSLWFVSLHGAEKPRFESKLRDAAITVDGRFDDWYGSLQPFEQAPVALQFLNDGEYLYMRMTVSSAGDRMQIVRQGFTVWFDPAGGTKKHFGVRYPVVERGTGGDDPRGGFGGGRGRGGTRGGEREGAEPSPADRIDVLGPGKDDARMFTRDHAQGIDAAIRTEQGTLQYELKVPIAKTADHPYAIEAAPGKTIGVGLETAKTPQRSFGMGQGGGGYGGGGYGGGMGGRGGGMGGRGGGGMGRGGGNRQGGYDAPKPIKGWGVVITAPAPAR